MTDESELLLTDHELLALLAMNPTEAAASTRDVFRLSNVAHRDVLERVGVTTLLARGMAEPNGNDIIPVERGAMVAAVLTTATEWLEVAFVTPGADHVMFVAASEHGTLLFSLDRLGAHQVRPVDDSQGLPQLGTLLARAYLEDVTDGLPAAAMVTHHPAVGSSRTANLKREADGWTLLTGVGDAAQKMIVTQDTAFQYLHAALSS